ncbi:MAG: hypothetical protein KC486_36415, partial [Myxococcales bacterium]|nr:hypothetical protein [Myxococcales bacterium]
ELRPSWSAIGFDPLRLPLEREVLRVFDCAGLSEGQLSPERRAALGLPPAPAGHYRPTESLSWWAQRAKQRRDAGRGEANDGDGDDDDDDDVNDGEDDG